MEMELLTTDCRVKIPAVCKAFLDEQNAARKATTDKRLLSIVNVVTACIQAGIQSGQWQEIAKQMPKDAKPLGPRARQPKKKAA